MLAKSIFSMALTITALSLSSFTKASDPWVGNFEIDDGACKNQIGPRPKLGDLCTAFNMTSLTQRIGM